MDHQTKRFVISLIGSSLSAAVLILLIPSLFESAGSTRWGIAGGLAIAALGFGIAARHARRSLG